MAEPGAWLRHRALQMACRLAMAAVYLVAAVGKLRDPVKFFGALSEYKILPDWLAPLAAAGMPGVELVVGLALLGGWKLRPAAFLAAGMMLVFMAAIASAMARGMDLDCSCFDMLGISSKVGWGVLGRDAVLLLICLPLLLPERSETNEL